MMSFNSRTSHPTLFACEQVINICICSTISTVYFSKKRQCDVGGLVIPCSTTSQLINSPSSATKWLILSEPLFLMHGKFKSSCLYFIILQLTIFIGILSVRCLWSMAKWRDVLICSRLKLAKQLCTKISGKVNFLIHLELVLKRWQVALLSITGHPIQTSIYISYPCLRYAKRFLNFYNVCW